MEGGFFEKRGNSRNYSMHRSTIKIFRGARMAQFLEALTTNPRVSGLSPWHEQTFTQSEESR